MVRFLHQGSETFINYISILDITTMDFDKLCKDILVLITHPFNNEILSLLGMHLPSSRH